MNEIIETYWNVNDVLLADIVRLIQEIIETYWNVNFICLARTSFALMK